MALLQTNNGELPGDVFQKLKEEEYLRKDSYLVILILYMNFF